METFILNPDVIAHISQNIEVLQVHIDNHNRVQPSADIVKPLIEPFKTAFPDVDIYSCPDCVLDMIQWSLIQYKRQTEEKPKKSK